MGENAKRRFEAEFTAERMNERLVRAYERVMNVGAVAGSDPSDANLSAGKTDQGDPPRDQERDNTNVA
jgi:hypothetical protein